ncbi:hypothetical protein BC361_31130 [Ensifer sp. LC54]|nr:hypothetical protein BC361_31130 [Ensifer sp. LC54]OCP19495.1 hypothetical protein BC363_30995 [Ensifer sp. LC384]
MSAEPIRRLPPPWLRTIRWLSIAAPAIAVVVLLMSPRSDLAEKLVEVRFLVEQAAALATAVAAAIAALCLVVPGNSRKLALLPVPPLAVWLGSLGQGCLQTWLRLDGAAWQFYPDWICFPSIVMVGAVPAVTMVAMLRRGTPMAPQLTVALGALAAAAIGNFGLRLFHYQDASLMVLIWQFGSVALLTLLAGWNGKYILRWPHVRTAG